MSGANDEADILSIYQPSQKEVDALQKENDQKVIDEFLAKETRKGTIFNLSDGLQFINGGMQTLVEDQFSKCFASHDVEKWSWNAYLLPAYLLGVFFRYGVLFPLRLFALVTGWITFLLGFVLVSFVFGANKKAREHYQRMLIRFLASVFVLSWSGVIKIHGTRPHRHANQVFVANHSSVIDVVILSQYMSFAVVGQKHPGMMGLIQDRVLGCLGGIWFQRNEAKDREKVARTIKEHINNENNNPLLIFPEGVCVNNEYVIMFKKGAFELGATVYPVAIKYNKLFVDAFWNSRTQTIWQHLFKLMTSWAVVCDVWFMEPQTKQPNETAEQFSERVKSMITRKAGLANVPWDGYLKYLRPNIRFTKNKQHAFAHGLSKRCAGSLKLSREIPTEDKKDI
jgi:glycerol-3-phosphate O-acyltransferase 3/4